MAADPGLSRRLSATSILWLGLKLLATVGPLVWLIYAGDLDFGALVIFLDLPWVLVGNVALFASTVLITTARWTVLLGAVGTRLSFPAAMQLQWAALFFNVAIPGNVGGDVMKALYVARGEATEKREAIFLIPVVERLTGLVGLLVTGALFMPLATDVGGGLRGTVFLLGFGSLAGSLLLMMIARRQGPTLLDRVRGEKRFATMLANLLGAVVLMAQRPSAVIAALLLSILTNGLAMFYFWLLMDLVGGQQASLGELASVFPLGMLSLAVPISQAGLGVGHVAFEQLFVMVGLGGGATVFNVFLIGQLALCLLGAIPFLALRSAVSR